VTAPARPWLAPLAPAYRLALGLRELALRSGMEPVRRLRRPVISIGNLSTGGAGKTPLTITLAKALARRGIRVDVLSRGYGRTSHTATRVDPAGTAEQFGDEPLEIARATGVPVYVAARRYEAGMLAEAGDSSDSLAGVHLLDDGFQHRQLHRDVNILLLTSRDFEDTLLPAGNLREPLRALHRATCIAIPAEEEGAENKLKNLDWRGPIWRIRRHMEIPAIDGAVVAFCGIARPEQFFAGLEAGGVHIAARLAFADHHRYGAFDVERLIRTREKNGAAACITTEKDRARLGTLAESLPLKTAELRMEIEEEDTAVELLMKTAGLPQSSSWR